MAASAKSVKASEVPSVKVWHVATGSYDAAHVDVAAVKTREPAFLLHPSSFLASGIKGRTEEGALSRQPWLSPYEQGVPVLLLVDGSGLFIVANMSALTGFVYLKSLKQREKPPYDFTRAFIIMSMTEGNRELDDVRDAIERGIHAAVKSLHMPEVQCSRVDDRKGATFKIDEEILSNIEQSGLIVCDLTEEKPNCYFELAWGLAHRRHVIVTARKGTKLHFDVSRYSVNFWESMRDLEAKVSDHATAVYTEHRLGKRR